MTGQAARIAKTDFSVGAVLSHLGYIEAFRILFPEALPSHARARVVEPSATAKKLAAALLETRRIFSDRVLSAKQRNSLSKGGLLNLQPQTTGPRVDGRINRGPSKKHWLHLHEQHDTSLVAAILQGITFADGFDRMYWLHRREAGRTRAPGPRPGAPVVPPWGF